MSDDYLTEAQSLLDLGDNLGARALIAKQLATSPDDVHALHLMSTVDMLDGEHEAARKLIGKVLGLEPEHVPAIYNLGVCQMQAGQSSEALETFTKALALEPTHSGSLYNVGALHRDMGDIGGALRFFERLIKANPNWVSAWEGYCETLLAAHRYADIVSAVDLLTRQSKSSALLYRLRGMASLGLGDMAQAETNLILSFRANDKDPDTLSQLANLFQAMKRFKEAIPLYEKVLVLSAQDPAIIDRFDPALSQLIVACRASGEWARLKVYEEQALKRLKDENGAIHPQVALQLTDDKKTALSAARFAWPQEAFPPKAVPRERPDRRFRVGFVSSTFGDNMASQVVTAIATSATNKSFDYYGYNTGAVGSANSDVKRASKAFRNVRTSSNEDIANLIMNDEVDLLLNLDGFEEYSRAGVLAYRPAPIAVSFANFPGSMGTKHVDYLIADNVLVPTEDEDGFDEAIVRIAGGARVVTPVEGAVSGAKIRMSHGLKSDAVVIAVFAEPSAIGQELLSFYASIMKDIPGSQLWMSGGDMVLRANLRNQIVARGIPGGDVVFADPTSRADHIERLRMADFAIDTFPLSRPVAVGNALLADVPVLTLRGRNFASRVGSSLVTSAGMPELSMPDAKSLHETAVRLARNPKELNALRTKMSQARATAPVYDLNRLRQSLERAFEQMIERHYRGEKPASFTVS